MGGGQQRLLLGGKEAEESIILISFLSLMGFVGFGKKSSLPPSLARIRASLDSSQQSACIITRHIKHCQIHCSLMNIVCLLECRRKSPADLHFDRCVADARSGNLEAHSNYHIINLE